MGVSAVGLTLACKDLKIPTAEIQHASVAKTSLAHYWGDEIMRNRNCKRLFPDYFLTFGKYWNDYIHLPSKKVVVGTHRKYNIEIQNKNINENVLICLSINCRQYINVVEYIVANTGLETKIYLRFHPLGNTENNKLIFKKYNQNDRFEFANDKNLEYYFENCKYMISSGSTVIYEALTCGKIVFVPKDQIYNYCGMDTVKDKIYSFETIQQFKKLWDKRATFPMKVYNDFYEMDYERLYTEFIKKVTKKQKKLKGRKRVYE
jgi:Capsule polysaccharide biosynthesis protein.